MPKQQQPEGSLFSWLLHAVRGYFTYGLLEVRRRRRQDRYLQGSLIFTYRANSFARYQLVQGRTSMRHAKDAREPHSSGNLRGLRKS